VTAATPTNFAEALEDLEEVQISFVRKGGEKRTIPIWFTVHEGRLELLPMHGMKTKWFLDVEATGTFVIRAGEAVMAADPRMVRDKDSIDRIKERFGAKYGEADVKKYYPASDVALEVPL
jgi:Uncharacterized protein conserved in bacteria (DUF2255)